MRVRAISLDCGGALESPEDWSKFITIGETYKVADIGTIFIKDSEIRIEVYGSDSTYPIRARVNRSAFEEVGEFEHEKVPSNWVGEFVTIKEI